MRNDGSRVKRLLAVLIRDPVEFRDRALTIAEARLSHLTTRRPAYAVSDWGPAVTQLGEELRCDLAAALNGPEAEAHALRVRRRTASLAPGAPFRTFHNGDPMLARLCYGIVRALEPECVLETGVCYGVTTSFILAALDQNRKGTLHSIDLPPLGEGGDRFVGWAISDDSLKVRWHLHRGISRKVLPALLPQIGPVDLFIHDSLHTYRNMRTEFELVWPQLRRGGVVIADDIQENAAFHEWTERKDVTFHAAIRELRKDSLVGILIKAA